MTKVILNVYDLNPEMNRYTYAIGFGLFHSGIEISSTEYTFAGSESDGTGVMEVEPKVNHPNFRESIELGETTLSRKEITRIIDKLREEFKANTYDLIKRNCNVFSEALCRKLLNRSIPGFVNRLAYMGGMLYSCLDFIRIRKVEENNYSDVLNEESREVRQFAGQGYRLSDF